MCCFISICESCFKVTLTRRWGWVLPGAICYREQIQFSLFPTQLSPDDWRNTFSAVDTLLTKIYKSLKICCKPTHKLNHELCTVLYMYILVHVWSCLYKADIQAATTLLNIANVISFCRHYCMWRKTNDLPSDTWSFEQIYVQTHICTKWHDVSIKV